MANLGTSGVTHIESWREAYAGKLVKARKVTMVLTSMGTVTNNIPASAFGLTTILECSPLINDGNDLVVVGSPNYDGTLLLLKAAGSNAPADYTDTFRAIVRGQ